MASAKAIAKIIAVCTFEADSGFLLIDLTAVDPIQPMEMAGNMVPNTIDDTVAHKRTVSASIFLMFNNNFNINFVFDL